MLGSALTADFVTEGRALIFNGKPGRGKTRLAVAIAYRAIQNGFDAFFTSAAALIDDLSAAFRTGELAQALPTYTHPDLLVVDEVGYLTCGTDAANMLFHVVNERHRRHRAMIVTTNKSLNAWGRVLHDEDLAQAILAFASEQRGKFPTASRQRDLAFGSSRLEVHGITTLLRVDGHQPRASSASVASAYIAHEASVPANEPVFGPWTRGGGSRHLFRE